MKVGVIGLGRLGLPVALAMESKGHEVVGFDINPAVSDILATRKLPYHEQGAQELLDKTNIKFSNDFTGCEIVFISVQTPHEKEYEGITPLPETRKDFDYTYLKNAVLFANDNVPKESLLVIISTTLPGTIEREILPITKHEIVYNPFFIAMGTTIQDFLNPEFILMGTDSISNQSTLLLFYLTTIFNPYNKKVNPKPVYCSIREAEMIKVSYNTFITAKICIANTIMEMCHKMHISSDTVMDALALGTDRIISAKYLRGGMGDGGGCHPRDNIALSWLAKELNLSYDLYESLMTCRDKQTEWLVQVIEEKAKETGLPIVILGKAFKKDVNITTGSPAILLTHFLTMPFEHYDLFEHHYDKAAVYFIATNHSAYKQMEFPQGSVVIDPWRYLDNATIKIG